MSLHPVKPAYNSARGPSRGLWNQSRLGEIRNDWNAGIIVWEDDFTDLPTGKYTATQATAGTFALDDKDGGWAIADAASATDTQGINVQLGGTAGETVKAEAGTEIIFEARIAVHDFGTDGAGLQFFLGLSETDTTVIASSANSSGNHIGFEAIATNALTFVAEKATVRGTISSVGTLVDADVTSTATIKLGFRVVGVSKLYCWVDGVVNATTLATANIPIVEMRPTLVVQADGASVDPLVKIDWGLCVKKFRLN